LRELAAKALVERAVDAADRELRHVLGLMAGSRHAHRRSAAVLKAVTRFGVEEPRAVLDDDARIARADSLEKLPRARRRRRSWQGAMLRLTAEALEDHLGVEVVALLSERVEERRERLGLRAWRGRVPGSNRASPPGDTLTSALSSSALRA
jgi:predicted RecB family endonuclease